MAGWVREEGEVQRVRFYVENNAVTACLVVQSGAA
jgi:hypothetical protein